MTKGQVSFGLSFSRACLARVKNPDSSAGFEGDAKKVDCL
jgi:hypothetical protein